MWVMAVYFLGFKGGLISYSTLGSLAFTFMGFLMVKGMAICFCCRPLLDYSCLISTCFSLAIHS